MKSQIRPDLVTVFAAGFIATALATSVLSGLLSAMGWTAARIVGSVGIEAVIATVGGVINLALNNKSSDIG
jgi:hypothetical protein